MQYKGSDVLEFKNQDEFLSWLKVNYKDGGGYHLKLHKKGSKKKGITYVEALEAALMYGWIDGVANKLDEDFFYVRFTHRRPKSIWSKINAGIVEGLIEEDKMHPEGIKEVKRAKSDGRWDSAY